MSDVALAWRQYRLERRLFWRNPSAAFFGFVFPLLLLGLLGAIFASSQSDLDRVVPYVAATSIMATTFSALAMSMTVLREQGVLKRMRGTPLPSAGYLVGARGQRGDQRGAAGRGRGRGRQGRASASAGRRTGSSSSCSPRPASPAWPPSASRWRT